MAHNLGLVMRKLFQMGTPRGLQKEGDFSESSSLALFYIMSVVRRVLSTGKEFANQRALSGRCAERGPMIDVSFALAV